MLKRLAYAGLGLVLLAIAVLLSVKRGAIRPRVMLSALALQIAVGALILFVVAGHDELGAVARIVQSVLEYGDKGNAFLFGGLVEP